MTIADVRLGLRAYLLGDGAIAALVSDRVYPVILKQGVTAPSIVYTRISGQGDHHMQGPSGLNRLRLQIDCYALSADTAVALADLVKERLDGFAGAMSHGSDSPRDTIDVQGVFFETERDNYDSATKLYGVSRDYFVWVKER